jgi:hypothetical protein
MKRVVQSIIAACALASASPAAAQIINGGFEEGAFGDGSVREVSRDDTALSGWTVNDNPIGWYTNGYEPPNALKPIGVAPHSGNRAINLCDGSVANQCDGSVRPVSISQTFTVLPFIEQQVSFWVGNYSGNGGGVSIGVTIQDGTSNTILLGETATAPRPISIRHGSNSLIRSSPTEGRIRSVFRRSGAAIMPASTTLGSPPCPSPRPGLWRCSGLRAWA